jgi:hypothetical protein
MNTIQSISALRTKIIFVVLFFASMHQVQAQCNMAVFATDTTLCLGGSTFITAFNTNTNIAALPNGYCVSEAGSGSNADITKFSLGSIYNSTNCTNPLVGSQGTGTGNPNKFSDFSFSTVPQPTLTSNQLVSFAVDITSCASNALNTIYFYIDYNRDGDFADSLEMVYTQTNINTPSTIANTFTVPNNITPGYTKARIIVAEGNPSITAGCGVYTIGETEDYQINLVSDTISYSWLPTSGLNTSTASTVIANPISNTIYTVTATDNNGCTTTSSILIKVASSALSLNISGIVNINCNGAANGQAIANVSGGTSPYNYLWIPSNSITNSVNNLDAGINTVIITDAYGCTKIDSASITQPDALLTNTIVLNSKCYAPGSGSISLTVSGGIGPYGYSWSPNVSTTANAVNLLAGVYTIIISDVNGCTKSIVETVTSPSAISSTVATQLYQATAFVSGGMPPYTYNWQPGNYTTQTVNGIAGDYTLVITDSLGCTQTKLVSIPAAVGLNNINSFAAEIWTENNSLVIKALELESIEIYTITGSKIFSKQNNISTMEKIRLLNCAGIYIISCRNKKGQMYKGKLIRN